jgi:hypothetical protein
MTATDAVIIRRSLQNPAHDVGESQTHGVLFAIHRPIELINALLNPAVKLEYDQSAARAQ